MKHLIIGAAVAATVATGATAQEVTLGRFFGACEDAGTDTKASVGEACIIQSIINAADAELDGITVTTLPTDWGNYYDQIKAAYAGGTPPDVHVMHRHRVPEFAGLGAIADISGDLQAAGIDPSYWSEALGRSIAMAVVEGGFDRMDHRLHVPDASGGAIPVKVTGTVFYDPAGERLNIE